MISLIFVVVAIMALLGLLLGTVVFGHVWTRTYMGWVAMFSGIVMYLMPVFKTVIKNPIVYRTVVTDLCTKTVFR